LPQAVVDRLGVRCRHAIDEKASMTEPSAVLPSRWRYGIHPHAVGATIRSLGRVDLPIGEALRLELENADPAGGSTVDLQYYISTSSGGWALWLSCPRDDLPRLEAALQKIIPPFGE
jgi:hypothetical protein